MFKVITTKQFDELVASERRCNEILKREHETTRYTEIVNKVRGTCKPVFDFYNPDFNVWGVERTHHGEAKEVTEIAYFLNGDNTKTMKVWYLFCSREDHNDLVNQYKQYLNYRTSNEKDKTTVNNVLIKPSNEKDKPTS